MSNLFKILNFLPIEIIYMIIPYTYETQSHALTCDIKSFYTTRTIAYEFYYKRFILDFGMADPSNKEWFVNDLFGFSNQPFPTTNGYVDNFVNLLMRNFSLKTKGEVLTYIQKIELREVSTQINIFWGLFTLEERNAFLKVFFPENIIA
jgi:5-methylcytosine-specific restriction endonuclease McrBC GTP-binding regulatory subunit McrB